MLENQTPELFQDVNKPKYNGTLNLDRWGMCHTHTPTPPCPLPHNSLALTQLVQGAAASPPCALPRSSPHSAPHTIQRPYHRPLLGSESRVRGRRGS